MGIRVDHLGKVFEIGRGANAGTAKVLLYTVVPAAFVSSVPARLIEAFQLRTAVGLLGVTATFVIGAHTIFAIGLRRYTSGSIWSRT